jgi:hypothetical protein
MNGPVTMVFVELTERERSLLEFAAWSLAREAWARTNVAAQDREGRYFKIGEVNKFNRDAVDADGLVLKLRAARVPT